MTSQYVNDNQKTWDALLCEFQFAINTAKHESTLFTPAYLNFQREILPPSTLKATIEKNTQPIPKRVDKLKDTMELVRVNLARAFTRQTAYYDRKRRDWTPSVGDKVSKRERPLSSAIANFSSKLATKFKGNFVLTDIISQTVIEIADQEGKCHIVHVKDIKPYFEGEERAPDDISEESPRINQSETNKNPIPTPANKST